MLATDWGHKTEAEHFASVYKDHGGLGTVLLETAARHTGDNAVLSHKLLYETGERHATLLLVTKPYMERRAIATFRVQWPDDRTSIRVTSEGGGLKDYCNVEQPIKLVVNIMVGDMQRILEYPKRGLQEEQAIPRAVMAAYEQLIAKGFTKHLV